MPFPNFPHPSLDTLNLSHPIFSTVVTSHNLFSWVWLFESPGFPVLHYLPDITLMSIELMMLSNRLIFLLPPFPGCSWESCSLMHRAWNMSIVSGSRGLSRRLVLELVQDSDGDWEPGAWAGGSRWNEMPVVPSPAACPGLGPRQGGLQVVGETPRAWPFSLGLALGRHSVPCQITAVTPACKTQHCHHRKNSGLQSLWALANFKGVWDL